MENHRNIFDMRQIAAAVFMAIIAVIAIPAEGVAWQGKVVEKGTGRPIENAVLVRGWTKATGNPAAISHTTYEIKETVSDNNGAFVLWGIMPPLVIPLIEQVYEEKSIVFKPGYKLVIVENHRWIVELERVPTFRAVREKELEDMSDAQFGGIDFWETALLRKVVVREREFLETLKTLEKEFQHPLVRVEPINTGKIQSHKNIGNINAAGNIMAGSSLMEPFSRKPSHPPAPSLAPSVSTPAQQTDTDEERDKALAVIANEQSTGREIFDALRLLRRSADPRAITHLRKLSTHANARVRSDSFALFDTFGEDVRTEHLDVFLFALNDSDTTVRSRARDALIRIGSSAVEPLLLILEKGSFESQRVAIEALGKIGDRRAIEPLRDFAYKNARGSDNKSVTLKYAAIQALENFQDEDVANILVEMLTNRLNEHGGAVAEALKKKGKIAEKSIIGHLNDDDRNIRKVCIEILGEIGEKKAVEALIHLSADKDYGTRRAVALALIRIYRREHNVERLFLALDGEDDAARDSAARALISIGEPAMDILLGGLKNENAYIRWKSIWCLLQLKNDRALDGIIACLDDKVSEVRWMALFAIGKIAGVSGIQSFHKMLDDQDEGIQKQAAVMTEWLKNNMLPGKNT